MNPAAGAIPHAIGQAAAAAAAAGANVGNKPAPAVAAARAEAAAAAGPSQSPPPRQAKRHIDATAAAAAAAAAQPPMPIPKKPFLFKAFFRRTADVGAINLKEAVPAWWHVLDMACKLMCQQQEPYTTWDDVMDWIWKMDATDRCVRCEVGSVKVLATVQKNHVAPACAVFWTFQKSCFDLKPSRREILHGI